MLRRDLGSGSCGRGCLASLCIERLGGHVSAVGPRDGASLCVHRCACEVVGITQRLKDTSPLAPCEVDFADGAVIEGQAQSVFAADLDTDDIMQLLHAIHVTPGHRSAPVARLVVLAPNSLLVRPRAGPPTLRPAQARAAE